MNSYAAASDFLKKVDEEAGTDLRFGGDGDEGESLVEAMVTLAGKGEITFSAEPQSETNPSEAVFGFAAWLTTREDSLTIGATHDAAKVAILVHLFIASQGWASLTENWTKRLKPYPKG